MSILRFCLVPACLAGLLASPAMAQSFDGPYVGIQGGWSRAEIFEEIDDLLLDDEVAQDAFQIGVYAGYNYKATETIVIGAEAGFNGAFDDDVGALSEGDGLSINPRYNFDLSARAGYLFTPDTLGYIRGGYTNTRVRTTFLEGGIASRSSESLDGWQIGGGVEHAFFEKISGRLEYRYSDLGNDGGEYDQHQVLLGVSYNF